MATATKRMSIFRVLFASGIDVDNYDDVELPAELKKAQQAIDETNVVEGFNSKGKSSKGGFAKKFDPKTEAVLEKMSKQLKNRSKEDRER